MRSTHPQRIRGFLAIAFALSAVVFIAQPAQADFTPPNTPKLTKSAEVTAPTGAIKAFFDNANNVIHVISEKSLIAYDADTLAITASYQLNMDNDDHFFVYGYDFDAEHAIVFATAKVDGTAKVAGYAYAPDQSSYTAYDLDVPINRTVVYNSALDRVYSISTGDGIIQPYVSYATRDPGTGIWSPGSYSSIDIGPENGSILSIKATTNGKLVGTYAITSGGGTGEDDQTIHRKAIYSFTDTGEALVPAQIVGTAFSPGEIPYPTGGLPTGYVDFTPKADGSIAATEYGEGASRRMITLNQNDASDSGFDVNPVALTLPFQPKFTSFSSNGDLYFSTDDTLSLYTGGELFASSDPVPTVRGMAAGNGEVFAITGASASDKLAAYSFGGYSPSVTGDPAPQSVVVGTSTESKTVELTSVGTGNPAPTVRWQKLPAGSSTWVDISGATSPNLSLSVRLVDNGASLRAVYKNVAGEIATESALITVTLVAVEPPVIPPVVIAPVGPPDPAAPQVKNGKSVKLKYKKGKSARVTVGTVTCASVSTCVYTLPKSIKFKIGKKSYKATVATPTDLEPGKSQAIYATVPASAIKALKGKKSKLTVSVQVANSAGKLHSTTMSIISKISA